MWNKIDSAPKDGTFIWIWSSSTARNWQADYPYQGDLGQWDGEKWFITPEGSRIKGASHWRELFDAPEENN